MIYLMTRVVLQARVAHSQNLRSRRTGDTAGVAVTIGSVMELYYTYLLHVRRSLTALGLLAGRTGYECPKPESRIHSVLL